MEVHLQHPCQDDFRHHEDDIYPDLLGTCKIYQVAEKLTIAYVYAFFLPGHPFEKNVYAQQYASNLNIDMDLRMHIKRDTQSARDLKVRNALNDLKDQLDLQDYDEIVVYGLHCRQFEGKGSYFEILRKFFTIEHKRDFSLHLKISKNYQEIVDLYKIKGKRMNYDSLTWKQITSTSFDIPVKAQKLMDKRMALDDSLNGKQITNASFDIPVKAQNLMDKRITQ